jgi:hypothetical protein
MEIPQQIRKALHIINVEDDPWIWEYKAKQYHKVHSTCSSIMEPDIDPIYPAECIQIVPCSILVTEFA